MEEILKASCTNCGQKLSVTDPSRPRGNKIPLILQCSHTVCEKCLMGSLRESNGIICTKCNQESKLEAPIRRWERWEEALTDTFPLNLYLLGGILVHQRRLVDEKNVRFGPQHYQKEKPERYIPAGFPLNDFNQKQSIAKYKEQNKSHLCIECERTAAVLCKSCDDFYCNDCFSKCHQFRSQRKHEKISIAKLDALRQNDNEERQAQVELTGGCTKHQGQKLDFFCTTCDLYCCSYCVAVCEPEHLGHTVRPMSEVGKDVQYSLLVAKEEGIIQKDMIEKELMNVTKDAEQTNTKAVAQAVINHFATLHGRLQNIESRLFKSITSYLDEEAKNTGVTVGKLQEHINDLTFLLLEADRALAQNCAHDMVQILKQLKSLKEQAYIVVKSGDEKPIRFSAQESVVYELDNHFTLDVPAPSTYTLKTNDSDLLPAEAMEKIRANPTEWANEKLSEIETSLSSSRSTSLASLVEKASLKTPDSTHPNSRASSVASGDSSQVRTGPQMPVIRGYIAPETTESVKVSHIGTLSSFYVLRTTDEKFLKDLTLRIQRYVAKNKHHPTEIVKGSLYLVVYGEDNRWYRGRVTDIQDVFVDVVYIDYGNSERVPKTKLRTMPIEFTNIPPLAIHCSIANVHPRGETWDTEAVRWFASVVDGVTLMCRVFAVLPDICYVDLGQVSSEDSDIPVSLSDAILFLEWGQIAENVPTSTVVKLGSQQDCYAANPKLEVGQTVPVMVSHIENPTNFYVQQMGETVNYIYSISKDLNDTYFQPPSADYPPINKAVFSPYIGMACAVQFSTDMQWYRGQVIGLPGNKMVEVHYIDYGNKEVVPYTNVRRVGRRTLRIPPLAISCSLSDVLPVGGQWSEEATAFLKKLASSGTMLNMYINSKVEGKLSVSLYESTDEMDVNLSGLLVEKGVALSSGPSSKTVEFVKPSDVLSKVAKEIIMKPKPKKHRKRLAPEPSASDALEDATPHPQEVNPADPYKLEVKLVKAEDPDSIYVAVKCHLLSIENMFDEMRTLYDGSIAENIDWTSGMNCACLKAGDETSTWYRGVIKEILKPDLALVSLTDTAEVVEVKFSDLRPLEARFENMPNPIKCRLVGIIPTGGTDKWSKAACEFVDNFVKTHKRSTFISKKGEIEDWVLPVDVYVCESYTPGPLDPTVEIWYTLSEKLVEAGLALPKRGDPKLEPSIMSDVMQELGANYKQNWEKPSEDTVADPVVVPPNLQQQQNSEAQQNDTSSDSEEFALYMRQGVVRCEEETLTSKWLAPVPITMDTFHAIPTYVDDQGCIYFHNYQSIPGQSGLPEVKEMQAALQERFRGSKPKPEDTYWHPGQLCIAQYHLDKHWYRAQFLRCADDEKGIVMFVDYGNVETCDMSTQLRKCTFRKDVPMLAQKGYMDNVAPVGGAWSTEALDLLHKLIVDNKCTFIVQSKPDEGKPMMFSITRCDGLDPAAKLVSENFASFKKVEMSASGRSVGPEEPVDKSPEVLLALAGEDQPKCSSPTEEVDSVSLTEEIESFKHISTNAINNEDDGSTIESQSEDNDKGEIKLSDTEVNDGETKERTEDQIREWYDIIAQDEQYEALYGTQASTSAKYSWPSSSSSATDLKYVYEELPESDMFELTVLGVESSNKVMIFCHKGTSEAEEETNLKYEMLLQRLQLEAPQQPQLHNPRPGNLCVACYKEDDTWYRARVVEVNLEEEIMVVQYVDYANYEDVPFDRVVVIKPEWVTFPAQAQPCYLWKIERPDHFDELEVKTNLEGALIQRRVLAVVKKRTPVLSAELYNLQQTELAYATLLETGMLLMLE